MSATADIHSDAQHLMVWAYGDTQMSNESDGNGNTSSNSTWNKSEQMLF